MYSSLEDEFGDVIGKARRGQELDPGVVAVRAGIAAADLARMENYELMPDAATVDRLADVLGLCSQRLNRCAGAAFFPAAPEGTDHQRLVVGMVPLGSNYQMNGYVLGCRETGAGVIIDPGADADTLMAVVESSGLRIERILLTHGHHDHTGALAPVCASTGASAFVSQHDLALLGDLQGLVSGSLADSEQIAVGREVLSARHIPGHTAGSTCLIHPEASFVGDVLFAGSLGGTRSLPAYRTQLQGVHRHLLGLEDSVVLYPGHGPASTVGEERSHNPFLSGS
jgi:hydroxyacylglutathione hydrolase